MHIQDQIFSSIDRISLFDPTSNKLDTTINEINGVSIKQIDKEYNIEKQNVRFCLDKMKNLDISIANADISEILDIKDKRFVRTNKVIIDITLKDIDTCVYNHGRIIIPRARVDGKLNIVNGILKVKNIYISALSSACAGIPRELFGCYIVNDHEDEKISFEKFISELTINWDSLSHDVKKVLSRIIADY